MRDTLEKTDTKVLQIANQYVQIQMEARSMGASEFAGSYWRLYHDAAGRALAAYKPGKKTKRKGGK